MAKKNFGIVNSSAAVGKTTLYVGGGDGRPYAFRRRDGSVRWKARTDGDIQSSPAIAYYGAFNRVRAIGLKR